MPKKFAILSLVESIYKPGILPTSAITPIELFEWLSKFFRVEKSSWAHLISIYNRNIDKHKELLNFNEEIQQVTNLVVNNEKTHTTRRILSKGEIQFNASGYIYLRYIIVHFEYFSCLAHNESTANPLPLFQSTILHGKDKYLFEITINKVSSIVSNYIKSMNAFLITNNINIDAYCKSSFTFRSSNEEYKSLYGSRIVANVIRYIDEFRRFLLANTLFWDENKKLRLENPNIKNRQMINKSLVLSIKGLVELLNQQDIIDKSMVELKKDFISCIKNIENDDFVSKDGGFTPIG